MILLINVFRVVWAISTFYCAAQLLLKRPGWPIEFTLLAWAFVISPLSIAFLASELWDKYL